MKIKKELHHIKPDQIHKTFDHLQISLNCCAPSDPSINTAQTKATTPILHILEPSQAVPLASFCINIVPLLPLVYSCKSCTPNFAISTSQLMILQLVLYHWSI